jgi:hypothetical protein
MLTFLKKTSYNKLVLTLALVLLNLNCIIIYAQCDTSSLKIWSSNSKLKWADFKGIVPSTHMGKNYDAFTSTLLSYHIYEEDILPNCKVVVYFMKMNSWAKDTSKLTLIEHEQVHFDLIIQVAIYKNFSFMVKTNIKRITFIRNPSTVTA